MATVRQIAYLAGVAPCTVSRALAGNPHVSPETRDRIRELAELYHYRPNRLAEGVLTGKTSTVGCIVPSVTGSFYAGVLQGALEVAFEESYHIITLQTHHKLVQTHKALQTLIEQRVEGVLIASGHSEPLSNQVLLEMKSHGVIPVAIDITTARFSMSSVGTDENRVGEIAIEYLYRLGHRHIAYFGNLSSDRHNVRALAVKTAMQKHGLATDRFYDIDENGVYRKFVVSAHRPTAVFAQSDQTALQLMQAAYENGLQVPRDLSVIGCGNFSFGELWYPPLTTIEQYAGEVGRQAMKILIESSHSETSWEDRACVSIAVPPALVERKSCTYPRR